MKKDTSIQEERMVSHQGEKGKVAFESPGRCRSYKVLCNAETFQGKEQREGETIGPKDIAKI